MGAQPTAPSKSHKVKPGSLAQRRGVALLYLLITLLPLVLDLWLRPRYLTVWPLQAAGVALDHDLLCSLLYALALRVSCRRDDGRSGQLDTPVPLTSRVSCWRGVPYSSRGVLIWFAGEVSLIQAAILLSFAA